MTVVSLIKFSAVGETRSHSQPAESVKAKVASVVFLLAFSLFAWVTTVDHRVQHIHLIEVFMTHDLPDTTLDIYSTFQHVTDCNLHSCQYLHSIQYCLIVALYILFALYLHDSYLYLILDNVDDAGFSVLPRGTSVPDWAGDQSDSLPRGADCSSALQYQKVSWLLILIVSLCLWRLLYCRDGAIFIQ